MVDSARARWVRILLADQDAATLALEQWKRALDLARVRGRPVELAVAGRHAVRHGDDVEVLRIDAHARERQE